MATAKHIQEQARVRRMRAGSLRMSGLTFAEIGAKMGVSVARARELVMRFDRDCAYIKRWGGLKPQEYMALKPLRDWLEFLTKDPE